MKTPRSNSKYKRRTLDESTQIAMRLLLKDKGITVNLKILKPRNSNVRRLFTNITSTLDVMGIKYTVPRPDNIRVFTNEELELLNVTQKITRDQLQAYYAGVDYAKINTDMSYISKWRGKRATGVIIDDLIS
jgi:hypothetical protein